MLTMRPKPQPDALLLKIAFFLLVVFVQAGIARPARGVLAYQLPPRLPVSRRSSSSSSLYPRCRALVRPAATEDFVTSTLADPEIVGAVTQEQLLVGFIAGLFPFVWAAFEFWKRIDTQQRCGVCQGTGLVYVTKTGKELKIPRKCFACGGFLPWQGWRAFWLSNLDIGNGGVLQRPAADYEELSQAAKEKRLTDDGRDRKGGR